LTDYTVAVLEDSIHIMEILKDNPNGLTLAEITTAAGFVKNKVFRILYTLEKHHLVQRNERGVYHLGYGLLELGQNVQSETILIEASRPVMERLVTETSETIFLGVVDGAEAVCVAAYESPQSIRLFARVGRRAPLHSGGVPKVLLAFLPDAKRQTLLEQFFVDGKQVLDTGINRKTLVQQIADVQAQGYAIVVDELDYGVHSIAAPIRNHDGQVIAALSIAGPSSRFSTDCIEQYIRLVVEGGKEISQTLGYRIRQSLVDGLQIS